MNAPFTARVLYGYQQRAATFFYERDAAFLVAPLGAGKGAAALTALAELIRDGERRHALVIAPKLVAATVWPREVTLWPHLAHLLRGTPCLKARPGRGLGHSCVATCALTFLGELARIAQQVEQDSSLPPTDSTNLATPALRAVGGCFFDFSDLPRSGPPEPSI